MTTPTTESASEPAKAPSPPTSSRRIPLRTRLRRNRGRIARRLLAALLALLALLCGAVVVAYQLTVIPKPHPETVVQSTVFLDEKGSYLGRGARSTARTYRCRGCRGMCRTP